MSRIRRLAQYVAYTTAILTFALRVFVSWLKHVQNRAWLRLFCLLIVGGIAFYIVLPFTRIGPVGYEAFTSDFRTDMQAEADIPAIRSWLRTLDPNDCCNQPLNLKVAPRVSYPNPPKFIPAPPCISRLDARYTNLTRDGRGRPMIRLTWGGGFGHWGLAVGEEDMETPKTQERLAEEYGPPDRRQVVYKAGEYRLPLAPGAYVWHEIQ